MKTILRMAAFVICAISAKGQTAPSFVSQPPNVTAADGGMFTVNVTVNTSLVNVPTDLGFGIVVNVPTPAAVGWRVTLANGRALDASASSSASVNTRITASISFGPVTASDGGPFRIIATNTFGATQSETRTLTITPSAPSITSQPVSQTVTEGGILNLTVAAAGTAPLSFQWQKDGTNVLGATSASLTVNSVGTANAGVYRAIVTNSWGSVTSSGATITVRPPLVPVAIVTHPTSQTLLTGDNLTLGVSATGTAPVTFQWRKDGTPLSGRTMDTLVITNVQPEDSGLYSVTITNAAGSVTSNTASVTVNPRLFARLVNLSLLTSITAPGDSVTLGFVVGGGNGATMPIVARAVGPSLAALGVSGTIADPEMELFASGIFQGRNDNWGGTTAIANAMSSIGAFPFVSATSPDAALASTLGTRENSLRVQGVGGSTGIVLAEIYDAIPPSAWGAATPRLVNLSVLKALTSGGLSVGFVIAGQGTKTVLVRAVGPSLSALGVPGVLNDPFLTLYRNSESIASNDNWGSTPSLSPVFSAVGAFALQVGSLDAALMIQLQPGQYTAEAKGIGNANGFVLVEVYEVP